MSTAVKRAAREITALCADRKWQDLTPLLIAQALADAGLLIPADGEHLIRFGQVHEVIETSWQDSADDECEAWAVYTKPTKPRRTEIADA